VSRPTGLIFQNNFEQSGRQQRPRWAAVGLEGRRRPTASVVLLNEAFEQTVEANLIQPTFVPGFYPVEESRPLARAHRSKPGLWNASSFIRRARNGQRPSAKLNRSPRPSAGGWRPSRSPVRRRPRVPRA